MLNRHWKAGLGILAMATTATLLGACGGGGSDSGSVATPAPGSPGTPGLPGSPATPPSGTGTGTLRIALTDAPACGYDHVFITVDRVRVHRSSTAADDEGGWTDVVVDPARRIDLLELTNGVLAELGQTPLPAGDYNQVRMVLRPNVAGMPANAIVPTSTGTEVALDTPSATQSGLKLVHGFTVQPNTMADLVLDFDACRSIVKRGNSGRYNLKPVISVVPRTLTGIAGYVQTGLTGVTVSAQKNGVVLKATQPTSNGQFVLAPLDPMKGPYDVVFTGQNLTTAVIAGVPVVADQPTTLNPSTDPVTMPTSPSGTVTGNLGPAGARDSGAVRALQSVGAVAAVEVAHVNVDPTTGDYSLLLPTSAPRLLNYTNPMVTPLAFVAQPASAGKYKLGASAAGYLAQLGSEITVVAAATLAGQNFTLVVAP